MWPFSRKLEDVLNKTKTIKVHGIKFKVKKLDPTNYLEGSKIMLQVYDIYKIQKEVGIDDPNKTIPKLKDHYKDVFLAAVLEPKLARKESDEGIFVDNLFTEWDLAHKLYEKIMDYSYQKKKPILNI